MTFDKGAFFTTLRNRVGSLSQNQVTGIDAILDAMAKEQFPLSWAAYTLATPWHETKKTMQPVKEAYYLGASAEAWRKSHLRYWPYYGRGLVQLTWDFNYRHADTECAKAGLIKAGDIIGDADLVMRPDISAFILVRGMKEGWFTGASLKVLPVSGTATRKEYMHARRIINGSDAADLIEDYAQIFERALRDGGWA